VARDSPDTRYATTGDGIHIAYRVIGDGPVDLVFIPEWFFGIEHVLTDPILGPFYRRLTSFSRLIIYDKRGSGSSDSVAASGIPPLDRWVDDLGDVLDHVGSSRPAIFAHGVGGPLAVLFAAKYPERVSALVLSNTFARLARAEDYPIGIPEATLMRFLDAFSAEAWGRASRLELLAPTSAEDDRFRDWYARGERMAGGPGLATAVQRMIFSVDLRAALESIRTPTLVIHRRDNLSMRIEFGRYLSDHIAGARFVELPGEEQPFFLGDVEGLLGAVEQFLTGDRHQRPSRRVLATVLFSDIVSSTNRAQLEGDRRWRETLETYYSVAQQRIDETGGRVIKNLGDGLLVTFEGPTPAIRCAEALRESAAQLGLRLRAGIHTGECEVIGNDLAGIAVHIAARIQALAQPSEILVSRTVADLLTGSGVALEDLGDHSLKGVEGSWQVFAVSA
jgi:class 3 adenylate cyclase/pimeloyl-ACP methyl ester carboxylesterase